MKLITELYDGHVLREEHEGKKSLFIEGTFLQQGIKNGNGRIYPPEVLGPEVERYRTNMIEKKRSMGELQHPKGPMLNLDRVSHIVTECRRNGNDYIGKAKIIDTPMGKIAESLIQAGATLGVSSRGMGSLKEDRSIGANVVQPDFKLAVMIDLVADPSAPDAFVRGIMENVEWRLNEAGEYVQVQIEDIRRSVHRDLPDMTKKVSIFENFIDTMLEGKTVERLSQVGNVDYDKALSAFKRAKVHAKLVGNPSDPTFIYHKAREFLGVPNKKNIN